MVDSIHGWLDIIFAIILVGSTLYGIVRGFGRELQLVLGQLVSIAIAVVAIRIAWYLSHHMATVVLHQNTSKWPKWVANVLIAWQHAPSVGSWIAFGLCYLILSSILSRLLVGIIGALLTVVPGPLRRSHVLGGALGAVTGGVRIAIIGAVVFLVLQYFAMPWLSQGAKQSSAYSFLTQRLYKPWLRPLASRVFPVLEKGAIEPLSKNINLFAVPSASPGHEEGVLVVPKPIATLAHKLTQGVSTPRARARVLYDWEIHHVSYDWHKYDDYVYHHKWDQQSPLQTLRTGKGVCADYALLYADLAHAAGLTVQIDEGLGGSAANYGSHAWNKVWLPNQHRWMPVDTTWGAVQDQWFDVPTSQFNQTHVVQTVIVIRA